VLPPHHEKENSHERDDSGGERGYSLAEPNERVT
jgi:hypothetical protein